MSDPFRHHERHPITGACVWCGANGTSSVGCTRGPDEVERLRSRIAELEASLSAATTRAAELERELEGCVTVDSALAVQDELQRECDAWRALAEWESSNVFREVHWDGSRAFAIDDDHDGISVEVAGVEFPEGELRHGEAAQNLATKLGLIAGGKTNG